MAVAGVEAGPISVVDHLTEVQFTCFFRLPLHGNEMGGRPKCFFVFLLHWYLFSVTFPKLNSRLRP